MRRTASGVPTGIVTTEAALGLTTAERADLVRGSGGANPRAGALAAAGATCRLFNTVLTPSTWEASFAAAVRSMSLFTIPASVTTLLFAPTVTCFVGMFESALILL